MKKQTFSNKTVLYMAPALRALCLPLFFWFNACNSLNGNIYLFRVQNDRPTPPDTTYNLESSKIREIDLHQKIHFPGRMTCAEKGNPESKRIEADITIHVVYSARQNEAITTTLYAKGALHAAGQEFRFSTPKSKLRGDEFEAMIEFREQQKNYTQAKLTGSLSTIGKTSISWRDAANQRYACEYTAKHRPTVRNELTLIQQGQWTDTDPKEKAQWDYRLAYSNLPEDDKKPLRCHPEAETAFTVENAKAKISEYLEKDLPTPCDVKFTLIRPEIEKRSGYAALTRAADGRNGLILKAYEQYAEDISGENRSLLPPYERLPRNDQAYLHEGDSFTLFFDTGYFKHIPDLFKDGEILILFTFQEGFGENVKPVTKIIGPMENLSSEMMANHFGRVVYGPKRFTGEKLTVNIKIAKMHVKRGERRKSLANFIRQASQAFALANPMTLAEQNLTHAISQIIASFDEDEFLLDCTFDILPEDRKRIQRHEAIPFVAGNYGIIRQEQAPSYSRFFGFSRDAGRRAKRGSWWEYFAWLGTVPWDLATFPVVTFQNVLIGTPDSVSMTPLKLAQDPPRKLDGESTKQDKTIKYYVDEGVVLSTEDEISYNPGSRTLRVAGLKLYANKTWINFSIEKGRKPAAIEKQRKRLRKIEQNVDDILKGGYADSGEIDRSAREAMDSLREVRADAGNE